MSIGAVILILAYLLLLTAAWGAWSAAPWLPTKRSEREQITGLLPLKPGEVFYDLGCGDGCVLFAFADKYPEAKLIGYELSMGPILIGQLRRLLGGRRYRNVSLRFGDLFRQDLSDASAIFCFLTPKGQASLPAKFARELGDDCRVMIEAWPFPELAPARKFKEGNNVSFFLYQGSQFRG